jgi:hypothetical protein
MRPLRFGSFSIYLSTVIVMSVIAGTFLINNLVPERRDILVKRFTGVYADTYDGLMFNIELPLHPGESIESGHLVGWPFYSALRCTMNTGRIEYQWLPPFGPRMPRWLANVFIGFAFAVGVGLRWEFWRRKNAPRMPRPFLRQGLGRKPGDGDMS